MKKQINPTIKAHLIRGAFYLLLLVAVCVIPFALAQRNATKRGVANPAEQFVVPAGQTWNVESIDADGVYFNGSGPANSFNVFIYTDNTGLPGTQVFSTTNQPFVQSSTTFTVNLSPAAVLSPGTYWIEIQANMTFGTEGQWGWTD